MNLRRYLIFEYFISDLVYSCSCGARATSRFEAQIKIKPLIETLTDEELFSLNKVSLFLIRQQVVHLTPICDLTKYSIVYL